jgi:hypothetical protein
MKITKAWLIEKEACREGVDWFVAQKERNGVKVVKKLLKEDNFYWAEWLISKLMDYSQYVSFIATIGSFSTTTNYFCSDSDTTRKNKIKYGIKLLEGKEKSEHTSTH